jgi:hypothetical protein
VIWLVFLLAPKIAMTAPVRHYLDVTLQVDAQKLQVVEVKPGQFEKPTQLQKYRGRFAVRALANGKLLEEVRVDLPLMAEAETDDASDEARRFAERLRKNVSVKARVRVPLPDGTDTVLIVDDATGREARLTPTGQVWKAAPSPAPASAKGVPPAR